ncbi:MAG: alpha/beta hydrolase [Pseudomonadota bacterium]
MPIYEREGAHINYEVHGDAEQSLLLIAPGGMKSAIGFWSGTPWNPIDQLKNSFTVVAMDQRNAGDSTAPVSADDGWDTYTQDQLGLMSHLGIEQFHVAGMCIGGPYCLGLIAAAVDRIKSATLFQTIGRDNNADAFYAMFDQWAEPLMSERPDTSADAWQSFRQNMYGGDKVLFNVDEVFVAGCPTPLLVLMGDDLYHPQSSSRLIAETAPNVTFIERWKEGEDRAAAMLQFEQFLVSNS